MCGCVITAETHARHQCAAWRSLDLLQPFHSLSLHLDRALHHLSYGVEQHSANLPRLPRRGKKVSQVRSGESS